MEDEAGAALAAAVAEAEAEAEAEGGAATSSPALQPPSPERYPFLPLEDKGVLGSLTCFYADSSSSRPPLVGEKEAISALAAYCQNEDPIILEKIKLLTENYWAFRRVRGDGNCFYRSFMFSYLEHILETQDRSEVHRITARVEEYIQVWYRYLKSGIVMEDVYLEFFSVLEKVMQDDGKPWSHEELLEKCQAQSNSDGLVQFFRYVTSGEMQRREAHFKPFFDCMNYESMHTFCLSSERMGEECEGVHIASLSNALGVPIRIVNLDRSLANDGSVKVNHHDFIPAAEGTTESSCLHNVSTSDRPPGGSHIAAADPPLHGTTDCGHDKSYTHVPHPNQTSTIENSSSDKNLNMAANPPKNDAPEIHGLDLSNTGASDLPKHGTVETCGSDDIRSTLPIPSPSGVIDSCGSANKYMPASDPLASSASETPNPQPNIHTDKTSASESCKNSALDVPVSRTLGGAGPYTSTTIPSPHTTHDASIASTSGPETSGTSASDPLQGGATAGDLDTSNSVVPYIVLLYRPGHYDIIYPK